MGNDQSKPPTQQTSSPHLNFIRELHHAYYGQVKLLEDGLTKQAMLLKEVTFDNEQDFLSELNSCSKCNLFSHPNVLKVLSATLNNNQPPSSNYYKISLFIEHLPKTLSTEFSLRKESNKLYTENELLLIAENLISALSYFEGADMHHGDIRLENVFVSDTGYKLSNPCLGGYGAPNALYDAMYQQGNALVTTHNKFKVDVLMLGLTLLSLGSLTKCEELYDFRTASFDFAGMKKRLERIRTLYSKFTYELIRDMLNVSEEARPSFIELVERVQPYQDGIRRRARLPFFGQMAPYEEISEDNGGVFGAVRASYRKSARNHYRSVSFQRDRFTSSNRFLRQEIYTGRGQSLERSGQAFVTAERPRTTERPFTTEQPFDTEFLASFEDDTTGEKYTDVKTLVTHAHYQFESPNRAQPSLKYRHATRNLETEFNSSHNTTNQTSRLSVDPNVLSTPDILRKFRLVNSNKIEEEPLSERVLNATYSHNPSFLQMPTFDTKSCLINDFGSFVSAPDTQPSSHLLNSTFPRHQINEFSSFHSASGLDSDLLNETGSHFPSFVQQQADDLMMKMKATIDKSRQNYVQCVNHLVGKTVNKVYSKQANKELNQTEGKRFARKIHASKHLPKLVFVKNLGNDQVDNLRPESDRKHLTSPIKQNAALPSHTNYTSYTRTAPFSFVHSYSPVKQVIRYSKDNTVNNQPSYAPITYGTTTPTPARSAQKITGQPPSSFRQYGSTTQKIVIPIDPKVSLLTLRNYPFEQDVAPFLTTSYADRQSIVNQLPERPLTDLLIGDKPLAKSLFIEIPSKTTNDTPLAPQNNTEEPKNPLTISTFEDGTPLPDFIYTLSGTKNPSPTANQAPLSYNNKRSSNPKLALYLANSAARGLDQVSRITEEDGSNSSRPIGSTSRREKEGVSFIDIEIIDQRDSQTSGKRSNFPGYQLLLENRSLLIDTVNHSNRSGSASQRFEVENLVEVPSLNEAKLAHACGEHNEGNYIGSIEVGPSVSKVSEAPESKEEVSLNDVVNKGRFAKEEDHDSKNSVEASTQDLIESNNCVVV